MREFTVKEDGEFHDTKVKATSGAAAAIAYAHLAFDEGSEDFAKSDDVFVSVDNERFRICMTNPPRRPTFIATPES